MNYPTKTVNRWRRAYRAQLLQKRGHTLEEIREELKVSRESVYRYLREPMDALKIQAIEGAEGLKEETPPPVLDWIGNLNIIEFAEDPAFLDFKLNPMQKLILKAFYQLPMSDEDMSILMELSRHGKTTYKPREKYRELVVVAGMKGGKTILASVIACYEEYLLASLGDACKHYGFPKGETIYIINVATSKDQAEDTIYAHVLARIRNSPFYARYRKYKEGGKTVVFRDSGVKIRCGHSNSASIVGKIAKLVLFDELARFKDSGGKSSAEAIYTSLTRSVEPFEEEGRIVSISSPLWERDKIMSLYKLSHKIPNMLGFKLATWEMNPKLPKTRFKFEFQKNPEAAQRDFGADPSKPAEAYYRVPSRLEDMYKKGKKLGLENPIDSLGRLKGTFKSNPEFDYYLHGDPSARNDAFGLSLGHRLGNRVIIDLAHGFQSREGEVDVDEIKQMILEIIRRGFKIKKATFDTWAAVSVWQALRKKGIKPENLFVLKEQHDTLKEVIYGANLETYPNVKLRDEGKELILKQGRKVDHRTGGSKDIIDAVAAVAFHCMQEETVPVASGSKDPGEEKKGEESRGMGSRFEEMRKRGYMVRRRKCEYVSG